LGFGGDLLREVGNRPPVLASGTVTVTGTGTVAGTGTGTGTGTGVEGYVLVNSSQLLVLPMLVTSTVFSSRTRQVLLCSILVQFY